MATSGVSNIKHIVLVLSGKGGVGKSTVTTELALSLWNNGEKKVGILDVDLTGPSMPRMLGIQSKQVHQGSSGWVPVWADEKGTIRCMSIGFLLKGKDDAVIWRGPKKTAMIKQFIEDVVWGELDYLIVDTPPGTSDEHISLVEYLKEYNPDGAVLVTTPQAISILDVRKELSFCKKVGIRVLGIIENMSGYVCPHCAECTNVFSKGGGEKLAKEHDLPYLGSVPIDPALVNMIEASEGGIIGNFEKSALYPIFKKIAEDVHSTCSATSES
ncbi:Nucleotide-binding protein 2 [Dinochytrium kinnereticum]|nr:Nucleotide-binding protein 2 [Dinochytrium kinnereticum]